MLNEVITGTEFIIPKFMVDCQFGNTLSSFKIEVRNYEALKSFRNAKIQVPRRKRGQRPTREAASCVLRRWSVFSNCRGREAGGIGVFGTTRNSYRFIVQAAEILSFKIQHIF